MEKSYLINDYVNELENNKQEVLNAEEYSEKYFFRTNGSRSISELKKEVGKFLEQNDVDQELKNELIGICDSLNENSDLYQSSLFLENTVKAYIDAKKKSLNIANEQVDEIKTGLIEKNIGRLNDVGISVTGDISDMKDAIQNVDDVYSLERNVDEAINYYYERNKTFDSETMTEMSIHGLKDALHHPNESNVLDTALNDERKTVANNKPLQINDDGTIQINSSNKNPEAMNFVAMITLLLATNNSDFSLNTGMDIKFIKERNVENDFRVIYGYFPLPPNGNNLDPTFERKIYELANSYNPNVSYSELLSNVSPELQQAFQIIGENAFDQTGEFKMAVKSNGSGYDIKMGMDENYQDIIDAFSESGAYMFEDMDGTIIIIIPNNINQLAILNAVLESLKQKGYSDEQAQNLVNQYQKKLVYNNESANVPAQLLIIITLVCVIEILGFLYFILK